MEEKGGGEFGAVFIQGFLGDGQNLDGIPVRLGENLGDGEGSGCLRSQGCFYLPIDRCGLAVIPRSEKFVRCGSPNACGCRAFWIFREQLVPTFACLGRVAALGVEQCLLFERLCRPIASGVTEPYAGEGAESIISLAQLRLHLAEQELAFGGIGSVRLDAEVIGKQALGIGVPGLFQGVSGQFGGGPRCVFRGFFGRSGLPRFAAFRGGKGVAAEP